MELREGGVEGVVSEVTGRHSTRARHVTSVSE